MQTQRRFHILVLLLILLAFLPIMTVAGQNSEHKPSAAQNGAKENISQVGHQQDLPPSLSTSEIATLRPAIPESWRLALAPLSPTVLVIMDSLPWGSSGIQDILTANGISYDVINSSAVATTDFAPYAVVIVPSVQGSTYYTVYQANLAKFESYVAAGGILQLHAATQSSHIPYPSPPGGVINNYTTDSHNYLAIPSHFLVNGVPNPMSGTSASHNYFTTLAPNTHIICTRGNVPGGEPTLIEYPFGDGWVVASGQTLEFGYNNNQDAGVILENLILYTYKRATGGFMMLWKDQTQGWLAGTTLTYTLNLGNYTPLTETFNLDLSGNTWPTVLLDGTTPITHTPVLSPDVSFSFDVQVSIPPGAAPGTIDNATVMASSVVSPTIYSDTVTLTSFATTHQIGYVFSPADNAVSLVDTQLHRDTGRDIDGSPYGSWLYEGALSPDGSSLYAVLRDPGTVLIIDIATLTVTEALPVGDTPQGMAFTADGSYALVANRNSGTISVIDTSALTVTANITVGISPQNIAMVPCLDKAYVVDRWDHEIHVLDTVAMTVTSVITGFTDQLWDIVASPFGHRVYATNQWDQQVYVIDTATDTWVDTWTIGGGSIEAIDVSPDGRKLYVTSNADGYTYVLDAFTGQIRDILITGEQDWNRGSWNIEIFPESEGNLAYVTAPEQDSISVINTSTDEVIGSFAVSGGPRGLALFPETTTCRSGEVLLEPADLYHYGSGGDVLTFTLTAYNVSGVDMNFSLALADASWPAAVPLPTFGPLAHHDSAPVTVTVEIPSGSVAGDFDQLALVATATSTTPGPTLTAQADLTAAVPRPGFIFNAANDEINVVDTQFHNDTGLAIDTSAYGSWPWEGALSPGGSNLYAVVRDNNQVLVVDTTTLSVTAVLTVGNQPQGMAFTPDGTYALVTNRDDDTLTVLDTTLPTVTMTIPVGDGPQNIAMVPCLSKAYVVNRWDYSVSVIDTVAMTVTDVITGFTARLWDVVASPFGDRVYVSNQWDRAIYVIDPTTDTWIDTWTVGDESLEALDLSPFGDTLYATSNGDGLLYALDTSSGDLLATTITGGSDWAYGGWNVEVFPSGEAELAYVTVPGDGSGLVRVIDRTTNTITRTIGLGGGPRGLALFPEVTTCYHRTYLPIILRSFP